MPKRPGMPHTMPRDVVEKITAMIQRGYSASEVAFHLNCDKKTVIKYGRQEGVYTSPPRGRRMTGTDSTCRFYWKLLRCGFNRESAREAAR